jgi:hypothetical protein
MAKFSFNMASVISVYPPHLDHQYVCNESIWFNRSILDAKHKPSGALKIDHQIMSQGFLVINYLINRHPYAKHLSQLIPLEDFKKTVGMAAAKRLHEIYHSLPMSLKNTIENHHKLQCQPGDWIIHKSEALSVYRAF